MKLELSKKYIRILTKLIELVNKGDEVMLFGNIILGKDNRVKPLNKIDCQGYAFPVQNNVSHDLLIQGVKSQYPTSKKYKKNKNHNMERMLIREHGYTELIEKSISEIESM